MRATPESGKRGSSGWVRGLRVVVAAALAATVLAACGGSSDNDAGGDGKVHLRFWAARDFYMPADHFEQFMKDNPDIIVDWDVQADDDILQQVSRMKGAGQQMPDVIQDDPFRFPAYVQAGLVNDLQPMMDDWKTEDPDTFDLMPATSWEQAVVDGKPYGMGTWTTFDQVYVNLPWIEEAGVQLPFESLDDVYEAAVAMKQSRPDAYPLSVQAQAGSGVNSLWMILFAAGVEFNGDIPLLTSEGGTYAIDWYKRMKDADLIDPDAVAWGEDESRIAFLSGKAGLMIDSVRAGQDFVEAPDFAWKDQWDLALLPRSKDGADENGVWTTQAQTYAITSDTKHPDEAALLMRYLASTQNLVDIVVELGGLPPLQTEAMNDPAVKDAYEYLSDDMRGALLEATGRPVGPETADVEAVLEKMFDEIVAGTDETTEQLAERYQGELDALRK